MDMVKGTKGSIVGPSELPSTLAFAVLGLPLLAFLLSFLGFLSCGDATWGALEVGLNNPFSPRLEVLDATAGGASPESRRPSASDKSLRFLSEDWRGPGAVLGLREALNQDEGGIGGGCAAVPSCEDASVGAIVEAVSTAESVVLAMPTGEAGPSCAEVAVCSIGNMLFASEPLLAMTNVPEGFRANPVVAETRDARGK